MLKTFVIVLTLVFVFPIQVFAHAVVSPSSVGVAQWQVFTLGVPAEKQSATTQVRLVLPDGLKYVTPTVKTGWTIEVVRQGEGELAKTTEIIWKGGMIPAGQRDEFSFSVQVPANPTLLVWKAYQTYEDGSTVAWDKDPENKQPETDGKPDFSSGGPFSKTEILNDLGVQSAESKNKNSNTLPLTISVISLVLALIALSRKPKDA